jgi:hypothetical protein
MVSAAIMLPNVSRMVSSLCWFIIWNLILDIENHAFPS